MLKRAYPYSTDETLFLLNGKRENIDSSAAADSERVIRDFGHFRGREGHFDKGRPRFCRFSRTGGRILGENVRPSGKSGTPDSEAKDRVLSTHPMMPVCLYWRYFSYP